MQESEQALSDVADSAAERNGRIAKHILEDANIHRLWESRHAQMVLPVADCSRRAPQIVELRKIEVKLIHRRALIEHIRRNKVSGELRDKLFARFYGPKDCRDAVLAEHRQFMLAVSSHVSTDRLINIMFDPVSTDLLNLYEGVYNRYFELYCFSACSTEQYIVDAIRPTMLDEREKAMRIRARLERAAPSEHSASFDRQAALARSGRYPVLNYMLN